MPQRLAIHDLSIADGDIVAKIDSLRRYRRAGNLSPRTVQTYMESARQLARFLAKQGMLRDVANIGHTSSGDSFLRRRFGQSR